MPDHTLLIATGNPGKAREFHSLLRPLLGDTLKTIPLSALDIDVPHVVEDAPDFRGNALEKARSAALATGLTTLADDSGLVVDALDGAPGVHSARFAGPHATDKENNALLLQRLRDLHAHSPDERRARFVCVLSLVLTDSPLSSRLRDLLPPDRLHHDSALFRGECHGYIASAPRGHQGFGYDPLFVDPDTQMTFAELSPPQKSAISHRAHAVAALKDALLPP